MGTLTSLDFYIEERIKENKREEIRILLEKLRKTAPECFYYDIPDSGEVYRHGVGITTDGYLDDEEYKVFLDIGKQLYDLAHPLYGCAEYEGYFWNEDPPFHNDEEIKEIIYDLKVKYIYWVNFFGPKLVQKIGREKLLSAPSWKTEELKDGGILLMLGPTPFPREVPREEVEKHLGFPYLYMFSLGREYEQHLRKCNVDKLRNVFKDNKHHISQDAKVSEIDAIDWEISDGIKRYKITDVGTELKVSMVLSDK